MIKKIILASLLSIFMISCKKDGNKGVVKAGEETPILADNGKPDSTISYKTDVDGNKSVKTDFVYKATDGSLANVVFNYDPEKRSVSITSNNKTFILDKTEAKTNETTYEKADMKATVKGDSLIIHQGDNVIELVKTKI